MTGFAADLGMGIEKLVGGLLIMIKAPQTPGSNIMAIITLGAKTRLVLVIF